MVTVGQKLFHSPYLLMSRVTAKALDAGACILVVPIMVNVVSLAGRAGVDNLPEDGGHCVLMMVGVD